MELLQLQYFQVVARLEHMTDAARSLHVTQSSLSKTIQRLEEDLGVPLFDRSGRSLRLNQFGRTFLHRVERALFELEQGRQEISDLSSPESGSVELAVNTAGMLPEILRKFRGKQPHVHFHVQMSTTDEMRTLLRRGEVDFCLSSPPVRGDDIECQVMLLDSILVAVPKGHRLSDGSSIAVTELKDEWFVGLKRGYSTRDITDRICQSVGFTPKHVYEGDEPARLRSLVEADIGLAFVPESSTWGSTEGNVQYLRIEHRDFVREIGLSWHRRRYLSRTALEFREIATDYFNRLPHRQVHSTSSAIY
ncbi:LysR family transcriptional regulator [Alicyclobacillus fastidiosus]|uniref:LysR substrate-binding domain-containing protein n=1 Tax=Alicyclobacillus fastidiosus TaxID=392011 RepID=A0ABV5AJ50_9BACL|nr:LysR family transcriptional regulator [Alicyclobacillus fastidiosus]WEH07776.1 LysR substrate-binding domain-containing protein [Alicyclobacillus fastidiosus]